MKRKMKHAEQRRRMRKKKKNEIYRSVRNINVARNSNQNYAQSIKFSVRYLSQRLILITLSEFHNTKKIGALRMKSILLVEYYTRYN